MIKQFFKEKRIKITKSRIEIFKILSESKDSLAVEDIYNLCKERDAKTNLSTVYRTLDLFYSHDMVDKIDLGQGKYTYTLKEESHKHILKCNVCNSEIEVPCPMKQIEEILKNQTGFTLTEHSLELKGICNKCKKR